MPPNGPRRSVLSGHHSVDAVTSYDVAWSDQWAVVGAIGRVDQSVSAVRGYRDSRYRSSSTSVLWC